MTTLSSASPRSLVSEGFKMPSAATSEASTVSTTEDISPLGESLREATAGRYGEVRRMARATLEPEMMVRDPGQTMAQAREWTLQTVRKFMKLGLAGSGFPIAYGGLDDVGRSVVDFEMTAHGDLSVTIKSGVHFGLFGGAVQSLGTDFHHELYMADIVSMKLQGCFAMTEKGHGSDVSSLQTTLTYDAKTDEIVVDSPTDSATKTYIGSAADDAEMAVVFGQLIVAGKLHGVHAAMVPLRTAKGVTLPGVTTGDNGVKGGLAGVDNGTLNFDAVRIPREMLLNRYGGITEDGQYASDIDNPNRRFFTMLGTLVRGRICIAAGGAAAGRRALSIATRYSVQRRQFSAPDRPDEVLLLDYLAHQRKLIPAIAHGYALQFAQNDITDRLQELHESPEPDHVAQRELETRAAGLKAVSTRFGNDTIQMCREACGGAGYMAENGLTVLRGDADVFATFEGDNTVLLQLVAKGLLSSYKEMFGSLDMAEMIGFAARSFGGMVLERSSARGLFDRLIATASRRSEDDTLLDRGWHLSVFQDRERHLLETLAARMRSAGKGAGFDVVNATQDHLLHAAQAHMDRMLLESFIAGIDATVDDEARAKLEKLCDLYALSVLEADGSWLQAHNRMTGNRSKAVTAQINELCGELREDIIPVVEGMGFPVAWLQSAMLEV